MNGPIIHECRPSRTCCCGPTALEPNERCPAHGIYEGQPQCEICGRFMKRRRHMDCVIPDHPVTEARPDLDEWRRFGEEVARQAERAFIRQILDEE